MWARRVTRAGCDLCRQIWRSGSSFKRKRRTFGRDATGDKLKRCVGGVSLSRGSLGRNTSQPSVNRRDTARPVLKVSVGGMGRRRHVVGKHPGSGDRVR